MFGWTVANCVVQVLSFLVSSIALAVVSIFLARLCKAKRSKSKLLKSTEVYCFSSIWLFDFVYCLNYVLDFNFVSPFMQTVILMLTKIHFFVCIYLCIYLVFQKAIKNEMKGKRTCLKCFKVFFGCSLTILTALVIWITVKSNELRQEVKDELGPDAYWLKVFLLQLHVTCDNLSWFLCACINLV